MSGRIRGTKVREDTHGIYVIADGSYFRPVFPVGYKVKVGKSIPIKEGTVIPIGSLVRAERKLGTPLVRLKHDNTIEHWFCHGHLEHSNDSNTQYKPSYFEWEA